ncbi:MAG: NAD(P)/FAD-dependent oxidoreductase [Rhizobiales bacterium]|nr:NAD(P)/FAD-dependent oxidoreductase [Hyphomicrobiales bacterium]
MDKPDLLIIGLDRLGLDLAMAASALGASVVLAMQGETALEFAQRDGEYLVRLASMPFSNEAEGHLQREQLSRWITTTRSSERLRAARVRVEPGQARFLDTRRIALGERILTPRRIVIATGRAPDQASGFPTEPFGNDMPKRVVISGRSPISIALASVAMRAGTRTSLVPAAGLSDLFDPEMSALGLETLERQGLARLSEIPTLRPAEVPVWQEPKWQPALDGLGLEMAGIKHLENRLVLNARLETSLGRVSAIGTVTGQSDASMVGYLLARLMFRKPGNYASPLAMRVIPGMPELAEIGLTEQEARKRWGRVAIHRANASELGPVSGPLAAVKLICHPKGRLVGASCLAPDAVELASIISLAIGNALGLEAVARLSLPQGAGAETLRLAASAPQRARLRSPRLQAALRFMRKFG